MTACNIRDDGEVVACGSCGLAWASDARVRPCCPRGDRTSPADGWSRGKVWMAWGLGIGLAINAALGVVIAAAIVTGCAQ